MWSAKGLHIYLASFVCVDLFKSGGLLPAWIKIKCGYESFHGEILNLK